METGWTGLVESGSVGGAGRGYIGGISLPLRTLNGHQSQENHQNTQENSGKILLLRNSG